MQAQNVRQPVPCSTESSSNRRLQKSTPGIRDSSSRIRQASVPLDARFPGMLHSQSHNTGVPCRPINFGNRHVERNRNVESRFPRLIFYIPIVVYYYYKESLVHK